MNERNPIVRMISIMHDGIFAKNGYSNRVVMSSELYDKFARINRIDQAIYESEQELLNGAEAVDAELVFAELERKHFG